MRESAQHRHPHRSGVILLSAAAGLTLASVAGCTAAGPAPVSPRPVGTTGVPSPRPVPSPTRVIPLADTAFVLDDVEKVFVSEAGQSGSQDVTDIRSLPRGTWELEVACTGPGTIDVSLSGLATFTTQCDEATPEYDEIALSITPRVVHVRVTAHTTGHWALAVGWTHEVVTPPK